MKDSNYNHIDEVFSQKLKNYSKSVPDDVWEGIESSLESGRKIKLNRIYKYAAAIAAIAIIGSVYLFSVKNQDLKTNIIANNTEGSDTQTLEKPDQKQTTELIAESTVVLSETDKESEKPDISENKVEASSEVLLSINEVEKKSTDSEIKIEEREFLAELNTKMVYLKFQTASLQLMPVNTNERITIQPNDLDVGMLLAANDQNKIQDTKSKGEWSVGADFSPVYSYRLIGKGYNSDYYNNVESPITSYSGGINLQYKAKDRLAFRVGVYYTSIGQSLGYMTVYSNQSYNLAPDEYKDKFYNYYELDNSLGAIAFNTPYVVVDERGTRVNDLSTNKGYFDVSDPIFQDINAEIQQKFQYIEVPIMLSYKLIDRKIDININGGVNTNFLIGNYVYLVQGNAREIAGFTKDVKNISYSTTLGLGIEYPVFNHIKISLEPSVKYFISKVTTNPNIVSHPYSFGLFTGIKYTF